MNTSDKLIVIDFIEEIWNQNQPEKIDKYVSPKFIDHSLPSNLPSNREGTKLWIIGTGKSFEHKTVIDEIVSEGNKVMLKIKMQLKHIGVWRKIDPTHFEIETVGYRLFKLEDNKIIEHWALVDGNAIESQLREVAKGCEIKK